MILLARYVKDRCHVCGRQAEYLANFEVGGCWHGKTETCTYVPLCREHDQYGIRIPGCKVSRCGGSSYPGTPQEKATMIKQWIDDLFPGEIQQLRMF